VEARIPQIKQKGVKFRHGFLSDFTEKYENFDRRICYVFKKLYRFYLAQTAKECQGYDDIPG
jgi:hypothetical protein